MKKIEIKETEIGSGVYLYTQESYSDIKYLVTISGYTPFLQIEQVFYLSENRVVSKDRLRNNNFKIEKMIYG